MAIIMLLIAYYTCDEILKIWKYIVSNFLENRHFPFLTSNLKEKFRWHKKNNCNKNSIDIFDQLQDPKSFQNPIETSAAMGNYTIMDMKFQISLGVGCTD